MEMAKLILIITIISAAFKYLENILINNQSSCSCENSEIFVNCSDVLGKFYSISIL